MHIGILQTDSVLPEFQAEYGNYPDMFMHLLRDVSPHVQFSTYDVQHGAYPEAVDICDAYIITGSKASVYEPLQWIRTLEAFVQQLYAARKKLIAVCFGHQLVAQCFGGVCEKSDKGWGVGIHRIEVHTQKPWMQPSQNSYKVVSSHQDQVTRLPPGAELIAGSKFCPNSMFLLDDCILTIQGHPEFSKAYAKAMLQRRRDKIAPQQFEQAMHSWDQALDAQVLATWFLRFIQ